MRDHVKHTHALSDTIKSRPEVRDWQRAKIAELLKGTWRAGQDTNRGPVPRSPERRAEVLVRRRCRRRWQIRRAPVRCTMIGEALHLENGSAYLVEVQNPLPVRLRHEPDPYEEPTRRVVGRVGLDRGIRSWHHPTRAGGGPRRALGGRGPTANREVERGRVVGA
jgi:hypothetical protein